MKNIELLEIGKTYKYKELCNLFGEPVKSSDSKIAQLKEWKRFFSWKNPSTQKYVVEEIYDEPREKEDNRKNNGGNNTSKYIALDAFIMDYIKERKHVRCTITYLLTEIGIFNQVYADNKINHSAFYDKDIPDGVVDSLFWKMQIVLNAAKSSLERLDRDGFLTLESYVVLVLNDDTRRELNKEDSLKVKEIETEAMNILGIAFKDTFDESIKKKYVAYVKAKIEEVFRVTTKYYYTAYDMALTSLEYELVAPVNKAELTRKFVFQICYSWMMKEYSYYEIENRDSYVVYVIEMINRIFTCMNEKQWDNYWLNNELDLDVAGHELFFVGFYLTYNHELVERKRRENIATQEREDEDYRARVVAELGEEVVEEYEEILPTIDWKRVMTESEEQEYGQYCVTMIERYYRACYMACYSKDQEERNRLIKKFMEQAQKEYEILHEMSWLNDLEI